MSNEFLLGKHFFTVLKAKDSLSRLVKGTFSVSYCYVGFLPVQKLKFRRLVKKTETVYRQAQESTVMLG